MKTSKLMAVVICIILCFSLASCDKAVDKGALNIAITEAESLTESDYTTASWQSLSEKLTAAKIVKARNYATQAEVDAACRT